MARNVVYPLYQLGGPQLRVFRTNFFIQLVRPGVAQPEDTVQFRIPMEMTRVDLRNYLESIYNVPVAAVRTRVQYGSNKRRDHRNVRIKKPDYKVAYVQLVRVSWPAPAGPPRGSLQLCPWGCLCQRRCAGAQGAPMRPDLRAAVQRQAPHKVALRHGLGVSVVALGARERWGAWGTSQRPAIL
uniref:Large ribosomal subunit protein uL23m n=1 Tax=Macaca mulatta TaxID=9544 RepID=A0A5F8A9L3_MACMU